MAKIKEALGEMNLAVRYSSSEQVSYGYAIYGLLTDKLKSNWWTNYGANRDRIFAGFDNVTYNLSRDLYYRALKDINKPFVYHLFQAIRGMDLGGASDNEIIDYLCTNCPQTYGGVLSSISIETPSMQITEIIARCIYLAHCDLMALRAAMPKNEAVSYLAAYYQAILNTHSKTIEVPSSARVIISALDGYARLLGLTSGDINNTINIDAGAAAGINAAALSTEQLVMLSELLDIARGTQLSPIEITAT